MKIKRVLMMRKKVTVLIRDLHLNDIFIVETTIERKYEESSIRNDFSAGFIQRQIHTGLMENTVLN